MQLGEVIPDAVGEHPDGAAAADEEGLPPPLVVLRAKLHVRRHDRHLDDRDNQDDAHDAEEPENIVITALILPQALENEKQLDEDDRKRDDAGEQNRLEALRVPRLHRNLTRDDGGLDRVIPRANDNETVPAANIDQRKLNKKPKRDERDKGSKRNRKAGSLCPDEEVKNEDGDEKKARD